MGKMPPALAAYWAKKRGNAKATAKDPAGPPNKQGPDKKGNPTEIVPSGKPIWPTTPGGKVQWPKSKKKGK